MKKENIQYHLTVGFIHIWDVKVKRQKGVGKESVGPENGTLPCGDIGSIGWPSVHRSTTRCSSSIIDVLIIVVFATFLLLPSSLCLYSALM